METIRKRKATGKLAELIKEFNALPCEEKIRRISETRVEMEKEVWLEKACDWLLNNIRYYSTNALGVEYMCEDFRNAMKGE